MQDATHQHDMNVSEDAMQKTDMSVPCVDTVVYTDSDGDGVGAQGQTMTQCLKPGEEPQGAYVRTAGDCADDDPLQFEGAGGICGDWVDDDCDGKDETCPTSKPAQTNVPNWDCTGTPPDNVYAWARFDDGKGFFKPGGCFVFFEGAKSVYYAQRVGIERVTECTSPTGCTCPTLPGSSNYDRRMYAFTRRSDTPDCPKITLDDKKINGQRWETQPVSNSCRKYLYQMHGYDIAYSHIASSLADLETRLTEYDVVELSCLEDILAPGTSLPHTDLVQMNIEKSPHFKPLTQ